MKLHQACIAPILNVLTALDNSADNFLFKMPIFVRVKSFFEQNRFTAITQVCLCYAVKNCRIFLQQTFTACMSLLAATSASELGRRYQSPQLTITVQYLIKKFLLN